MFVGLEISLHDDCTRYKFSEWVEADGLLEISYSESSGDSQFKHVINLPVMSKAEWEHFKRAGDIAFEMMDNT